MPRFFLALLAITPLGAQLLVGPYAGGVIRSGVPANDVPLGDITGVTWDTSGNIVFTDSAYNVIRRVAANGIITTIAGTGVAGFAGDGGPATTALLNFPSNPRYDAAGNPYFFDSLNARIRRIDTRGIITTIAVPLSSDPQGDLAFASTITPDAYVGIPVIQEFSAQSVLTTVAGGAPQPAPDGTPLSQAWFLGPRSIAFSHTGDMYIAEFGACLIRKISASGLLSTFAGTGKCGYPAPSGTAQTANLVYPGSIAIDSQDNVWVADDFLNLYSISQQGAISPMIKTPVAGGTGQLAIDAQDRIYVLGGVSFYRVLSDGSSQVILAQGTLSASGIGADSSGNVYFSENAPSNT